MARTKCLKLYRCCLSDAFGDQESEIKRRHVCGLMAEATDEGRLDEDRGLRDWLLFILSADSLCGS